MAKTTYCSKCRLMHPGRKAKALKNETDGTYHCLSCGGLLVTKDAKLVTSPMSERERVLEVARGEAEQND